VSGDFTRVGFLFWEWRPIRHLDPIALKLWLVIYTKSTIPGLWTGDVPDLSSQAFLSSEDTLRGLEILRERELIEFDRSNRVLRLTQLPDAGEWPAAPAVLKSWWTSFNRKIPNCQVRDAHVTMLRWLVDEGARHAAKNTSGKPSALHEQIWSETFATVAIPSSRRRGVRSFGEADMDSPSQPSLFSLFTPEPPRPSSVTAEPDLVQPVVKIPDLNDYIVPENVSRGTGVGEGAGEGVSVSYSGSDSSLSAPDPERGRVLPFPKDPEAAIRARLVNGFPARVNAARDRVADRLKITSYRPCPLMGGEQTLLDRLKESGDPEGDLAHVLQVAEAEALANHELRWLSWSLAEPKSWRARVCATLDEVHSKRDNRGFREGESVFDVVNETAAMLTNALKQGDP
jgi:hypothetical protein